MINFRLEFEGKKAVEEIQRKYKSQLSEKEILKTTAGALNIISRRAMNNAKREVLKSYTMSKKYTERMGALTKPAKGERNKLYAHTSYNFSTVPMIAFKHTDKNKPRKYNLFGKSNGGVEIEVRRGTSKTLKYAFIKTMKSGHIGIWSHGSYVGKKFVPSLKKTSNGRAKITQLKTISPFAAATSKDVAKIVSNMVSEKLPSMLDAMLQRKINKLTR